MYSPQQAAPLLHNGICVNVPDTSTFLNNPVMENQAIPHPQMTQWFQNPQALQMYAQAVGKLRGLFQTRSNRSHLHTWAYNYLAQNNFNNQAWQQWCGLVANFMEFLVVVQPQTNPPQQAIDRAADTVYKCALSAICDMAGLHQAAANDPAMQAELAKFREQLPVINKDIMDYRNGTYRQQGQQQQLNPHMYAPQQQPQQANYGVPSQGQQFAVSAPVNNVNNPTIYGVEKPTAAPTNYGLVRAAEPAPLAPVETYGTQIEAAAPSALTQMYTAMAQPAVEETTTLPVPLTAAGVVFKSDYYAPPGAAFDPARPCDIIYSPGGIISCPAYQKPDWKVTRSDSYIYTELLDPAKYIRFYTKFPDGLIEETIMEYTSEMEYLKHETNIGLKESVAAAHNKNGPKVIYSQTKVGTQLVDMQPLEAVVELPLADETTPVKMDNEFQGSTEMEIERMAAIQLRIALGLNKEDTLPAHEYYSSTMHAMDVTRETYVELQELAETKDLISVAKGLNRMKTNGTLPLRVFNHINERFTKDVNAFLADSLSMEADIDDFAEDIGSLFEYFNTSKQYGKGYSDYLQQAAYQLIGFILNLDEDEVAGETEEDSYPIFGLIERYTNLQTGWTLAQLTDRPALGEANLVSRHTHAALIEVVRGMYGRATDVERLTNRLRVITIDGAYLEVFRGRLVENAFMFKRTI